MKICQLSILLLLLLYSCTQANEPDTVIINADIFDGNAASSNDALSITDGRIVSLGSTEEMIEMAGPSTVVIDARGQFLMPGFIEGHGHFSGIGYQLLNVNVLGAASWSAIESALQERVAKTPKGQWITGRGWHQEKWDETPLSAVDGYPTHASVSAFSADHPIMLTHASGHSLFANEAAMRLAGISKETADPLGGKIIRDEEGQAIGIFEERAMKVIELAYEQYRASLSPDEIQKEWEEAIRLAEQECISKGVSSFQDAGSSMRELDQYEAYADAGKLDLRLWVMGRDSLQNLQAEMKAHRRVNSANYYYTCNAIKSEVDGALGAFGAWLLKPYHDKPDFEGQNTTDVAEVAAIADLANSLDMQLCVHAIGDRANRVVLDIFEAKLQDEQGQLKSDHRWRIEHAQHLDTLDIPRFNALDVIASMQGIHCTSDAPFVEKRLGKERAQKGAYVWRSLLDAGAHIANGTDAPVEDVDPIKNVYASVTRKREDNGFPFFVEQRMSRLEALKSYTIWNAYAAFEEADKGSLEPGKLADIVILSNNLLRCTDEEILDTKVRYTIIDGVVKFKS